MAKGIARYHERRMKFETTAMETAKSLYVTEFAGGREEAIQALSLSTDPQVQKFLRAITLKKNSKKSIYSIASFYGITVTQMVQIMRDGYYSGILNAMFRAGAQTAAATIQDAQPTKSQCPRCDGRKTILWPALMSVDRKTVLEEEKVEKCPNCEGEGVIRQPGSSKAQEMIFRATKVLEEKGLQINLQQNTFSGVDSVIDALDARHPKPRRQQIVDVSSEDSSARTN